MRSLGVAAHAGGIPGGKDRWVASADRAQSLYQLHLGHHYVMIHLSAFSRPHGWMAFCEEEPCMSLCPGHLAGRSSHIPPVPGARLHPHTCTLTQPHPSGSTALGRDWWDPPLQTTSPDHRVTTWTDNRLTNLYFSKKKFF